MWSNHISSELWTLTIPVGVLLAVLILRYLPALLSQNIDDESVVVLIAGYLLMGFMVGLPQWLILRRQFSSSSIWLLGSMIGFSVGLGIVLSTDLINRSGIFSAIIVVLIYAVTIGLILSRLLAYHKLPRAVAVSAS